VRIEARTLLALPARLSEQQAAFHTTGGLHACALFDRTGKLLVLREDVGRHNALDKLIGWALLEKRTPLRGHVVLLSGRASFEMMQKSHAAGIPVVAAISAPSSLAVEFARESGQTLAGFVRGRSMNLYAGAARIASPAGRAGGANAAGTRPTGVRKRSSSRRKA
jgi:FdhD protein